MASSRQYRKIARTEMVRLKSDALTIGLQFPAADRGALSFRGAEGTVAYDEVSETLTIVVTSKPMLVPESFIWQTVDRLIGPYMRA